MTDCFKASDKGWLMARAMMSDDPPAGYGTTMRMVLAGQAGLGRRPGARWRRRGQEMNGVGFNA
jgi:hypothetical protein